MAAIKFKKTKRYNRAVAEAGVEFTPMDDAGNTHGTFKVSYYDLDSKFVRVAIDLVNETHAKELRALPSERERGYFVFAHCFVHNWSNVLDEDDKEVPFSHQAVYELLMSDEEDDWLPSRLVAFAKDGRNFQNDPRATKDEEAKN